MSTLLKSTASENDVRCILSVFKDMHADHSGNVEKWFKDKLSDKAHRLQDADRPQLIRLLAQIPTARQYLQQTAIGLLSGVVHAIKPEDSAVMANIALIPEHRKTHILCSILRSSIYRTLTASPRRLNHSNESFCRSLSICPWLKLANCFEYVPSNHEVYGGYRTAPGLILKILEGTTAKNNELKEGWRELYKTLHKEYRDNRLNTY